MIRPFRTKLLQRLWLGVAAAFAVLALHQPAGAETTGSILGHVRDASGGALVGAQVAAHHIETGLTRRASTGDGGQFVFAAMPVGSYEVRIEHSGFRGLTRQGVTVSVGESVRLDMVMEVGSVAEGVTVVARPSPVNTQSSELSYFVGEQAILDLPLNGRNYTDLALLQPGVVAFPHRSGGSVVAHGLGTSINGQDPRSNVYLLDGTPQNDFTNGPAGSAAGTALGVETVREFRVEVNAYGAEFGRNSGGQINILTKSGTNNLHGSLYHFHRNDNFDARNFFDGSKKPEFKRNQYGGAVGGPIQRGKTFFFAGYEGLREGLGRTISTVVPDENARLGILPDPVNTGQTINVGVNANTQPYLLEFPHANGANLGGGLAAHTFGFHQAIREDFAQVRLDRTVRTNHQFFIRHTFGDARQHLPTDFPQFPYSFISRNQFTTAEYTQVFSPTTLNQIRTSFSRTRIGQAVQANVPASVAPFVPERGMVGDIDIGGIPRFGPQSSVTVSLVQNVYGFEDGLVHTRGRHLLKVGGVVERYVGNMVNPTFSLGIYTFPNLRTFLENQPLRFLGLTPDGALDRYWRFTLFGFYIQDNVRITPRLTLNLGLRHEFTTMPRDTRGRDSTLINLMDAAPTVGQLYLNPTHKNLSPRFGFAWDPFGDGKSSLRGGYGVYFNTNNQQNLIVTVTNPPHTPRVIIANPTFPVPPFNLGVGNSIRPVEWELKNPNLHMWNLSAQREIWADTLLTVGYAGSRGVHLLRNTDANIPVPTQLSDGTLFFPTTAVRPNTNFSTVELKKSDGNSWYNALIFDLRKRWAKGLSFQSSYTFARNIDTTQASTFFSDATNGTTSAMPEFPGFEYNRGLADYHAKHNWVVNFLWEIPRPGNIQGLGGKLLEGWQLGAIGHIRSGGPLTVFVQGNRSRSRWSPSLAPGTGFDRPSLAPGRTHQDAVLGGPDRYFDPAAFLLQPAGTLGNLGRGVFIGPNLRTFDLSFMKETPWARLGETASVQFRAEFFNLFNRANFAPPSLVAFAGVPDSQQPPDLQRISSFGRIRSTVTSSRQIQLGLRISF